jgi:xylose isomerase
MSVFGFVDQVRYEGPTSQSRLAYRHYDPSKMVLGKSMSEHLRLAVCYWHTFCSFGADVFGDAVFERPWNVAEEPMAQARRKAEAAFEFFSKLAVPFYCFHDIDVAPDGATLREYRNNLAEMVDVLAGHQERTGVRLLWGTANLFSHPRYAAGAATNPDPEVFACAATQVKSALDATLRLGGANYVLWGGREGYDTLLNTDLARERRQFGRFMEMVVEHKHRIGFKGTLLIEPKPHEPTKHQYDRDVSTVYGFLREFGLENEVRLNVECNHATLAGNSFQHEVAQAIALGVFGSIDANRGDPQNGWDTDQFPNSIEELTLVLYEILKGGGMGSGGFNFDAKVRRQSMDLEDLFHGHIGAIDALALALEKAARLIQDDVLASFKGKRYAGWDAALGRQILEGEFTLESLAQLATERNLAPRPVSGRQEWLENRVNQVLYG